MQARETGATTMLTRIPLQQDWRLRSLAGPVPLQIAGRQVDAVVPGDVHMALRRAALIPDPADDDHEHTLGWIGESNWEFATRLARLPEPGAERIDLVFHGIDTAAAILIDGRERLRVRNMHRTWRVPVPELAEREVALSVAIESPVTAATRELERLGHRWTAFSPLPPYLRKNACAFGWDWGPALPGSGIWRPVVVEAWSTARLAEVRPTVLMSGGDGVIDLVIEVERTAAGVGLDLEVEVAVCGQSVVLPISGDHGIGRMVVPSPERWWPAGLGPQALHDLVVTLHRRGGAPLDSVTQRIGFRELVVEQVEDEAGCSFGIRVNGVPLFVRGFNWIPDHTSVAAVTAADLRERIGAAVALGANLLRVWGGGVFESDEFYDICDEAGLLVWQDFLFACAAYPEEPPFSEEVEAEARENVTRLMPHPSLALWNGNNENLWFWFVHDWQRVLDGASWGERYYVDLLPAVVAELDPARTYLAGSPSSGDRWHDPNDAARGVVHLWVPDDYRAYDQVRPRFVSEFGFQGPPARATFDSVVHDREPHPFSPGVVHRQKAAGGTERINDVLAAHFGVPADFDQWYWLAQLNQARAVRYGIERFRVLEPFCRGSVVWQLNDCWPALSWSMIDSAGRWKPVAYAVREAYRERIVVLRNEDGEPALYGCNSTSGTWRAEVVVHRATGAVVAEPVTIRGEVPPHSAVRLPLAASPLARDELLIATAGGSRSLLLGATDREYPDPSPRFDLAVAPGSPEGVVVTMTAHNLLRDATLLVDQLDPDAHADRNVLTLLPGEHAAWRIATAHPERFTPDAVRAAVRIAHAATGHDVNYRGLAQLEAEKAAAAL